MTPEEISNAVDQIETRLKGYRTYLHRYPELSFQEHNTMLFVSETLSKLGIRHDKGVGKTGVVAYIEAPKTNRWIGLRSD
jgi:metal-dependent amidase/aminoacylase/carboxypeptidase family protein